VNRGERHNALVPRDHWIEARAREAIVDFFDANPREGYRRITFMMLDADIVAVSPSTTYRILRAAGRLFSFSRLWPSYAADRSAGGALVDGICRRRRLDNSRGRFPSSVALLGDQVGGASRAGTRLRRGARSSLQGRS
jgi:hypothetical protein